MNAYQIIKNVHLTEDSTEQTVEGKYTFVVHPNAKKNEIKDAIKEIFEREVKSVNVMNYRGKTKRTRTGVGKKADWKKAIITLKEGQEPLDLF
ncbi:MAG: 50S ribosomal protein L23 [Lentisphaeria bacterium]|nr:50S ribosomal protein L23 [Lentisphaeria bacterium]NQZ71180.1 50S ribosomal protein L23 [Lentisphaeria bacterium]